MERVHAAWATMLGVDALRRVQVVVRPDSPFAPRGWVSLLRLDETVTATVADLELATVARTAIEGVSSADAVDIEVLRVRLPHDDVLGPSTLFYPASPIAPPPEDVEVVTLDAIGALMGSVTADELDESGVDHVVSGLSIVRHQGVAVAACGWARWPADIAHLCVLTDPAHRGLGHATRVAAHAAARAEAERLIPQWRARVDASKAVARAIGFVETGTQLRVKPTGRTDARSPSR